MPSVPSKKYLKSYSQYATDYGVSKRTIVTWANKDYPLDDPAAMRTKLGTQKNSPAAGIPLTLAQKKELKLDKEIEKLAIANAIANGEYTENAQVREDLTRIATATRGALMRLENDLPGELAGLDSSAIQKKIREKIDEIMTALSDSFSALYQPRTSCPPSP